MTIRAPQPNTASRLLVSRGAALAGGAVLFVCAALGCEELIPRNELAVMARALPPGPEVTVVQQQAMRNTVRERTGVIDFEFSESQFEPEMKLPRGTAWIMGLFIPDQESLPDARQVSE